MGGYEDVFGEGQKEGKGKEEGEGKASRPTQQSRSDDSWLGVAAGLATKKILAASHVEELGIFSRLNNRYDWVGLESPNPPIEKNKHRVFPRSSSRIPNSQAALYRSMMIHFRKVSFKKLR